TRHVFFFKDAAPPETSTTLFRSWQRSRNTDGKSAGATPRQAASSWRLAATLVTSGIFPPSMFSKTTTGLRPARSSSNTSAVVSRSEEHTSELQSLRHLVCRLLLE